ncbi:MAG TPA: hypothetical protein VM241_05725 [Candidatus Thermoplasmatota archaeon]|nr:hypothetical protein [Candidatus Thermoplasmatota archaeon]
MTTPTNSPSTRACRILLPAALALLLAAPATALQIPPKAAVKFDLDTGGVDVLGIGGDAHANDTGAGICLHFTPGPWPGKVGNDEGDTVFTFPMLWPGGDDPSALASSPVGTGSGHAGYGNWCHDVPLRP